MKRPLTVIVHGYAHHVWGSEKVALMTGHAYRELGHEVHFVLPEPGPFTDRVRSEDFTVSLAPTLIPSLRRPGRAALRPLRFLGAMPWRRPDLLHATSLGPLPAILPTARLLRVPVAAQLQTVYQQDELRRRLAERADLLLPVSAAAELVCRRHLERHPSGRAVVSRLYPPVEGPTAVQIARGRDLRERWGAGRDDVVIGMVGQIIPRKGVDIFLQALALMPERPGRKVVPVLVGDAPRGQAAYLREVEDLACATGLKSRLVRTGYVQDTPSYMAALDILAVPSREEGFGLVAGEAQRCGAVPVAAAVGGLPHLVEDGRTGLLVSPAAPEELAGALTRLVDCPGLRRNWSRQGARRIQEKYGRQAFGSSLLAAIREIGVGVGPTRARELKPA